MVVAAAKLRKPAKLLVAVAAAKARGLVVALDPLTTKIPPLAAQESQAAAQAALVTQLAAQVPLGDERNETP